MLHAIRRNKAGQSLKSHEVHWKDLFRASEDSLTSMVFERLFYLPDDLSWIIIRESCYHNDHLPVLSGNIIEKDFWPHWNPKNTSNSNYVEPDVFIRYKDFDIIIEAKRWDNDQQDPTQWTDQIQAYQNEFSEFKSVKEKKVFLLALGGLNETTPTEVKTDKGVIDVIKCRWSSLLSTILRYHNKIDQSIGFLQSSNAISSIFKDLVIAFEMHGFSTGIWFEDFPKTNFSIQSMGNELLKITYNGR